jgi:hypothetical protein
MFRSTTKKFSVLSSAIGRPVDAHALEALRVHLDHHYRQSHLRRMAEFLLQISWLP